MFNERLRYHDAGEIRDRALLGQRQRAPVCTEPSAGQRGIALARILLEFLEAIEDGHRQG